MICGRVLVLPDCMAIMARELWREERVLLLDVNQASMGFYVLSGGHCLACRMTGLKAGCFLREGAVDMLCEEMAEQVEELIPVSYTHLCVWCFCRGCRRKNRKHVRCGEPNMTNDDP